MATPERMRGPEDQESEVASRGLAGLELDPERGEELQDDPWADLAIAATVAIPVLALFLPSVLH